MKRIYWIIIIVLLLVLIAIFSIFYLKKPYSPKYLTSEECLAEGGEITNYQHPEGYDPYNPPEPQCPDNKKNLGHVSDVDCMCICCK